MTRIQSGPSNSLVDEVRESLTMPMAPALIDEVNDDEYDEVEIEETACVNDDNDSISATSINTAVNSAQREKVLIERRGSNASECSARSAKSTRSVRSFFRRKKSNVDDDDNTVASSKSRGWWNRSTAKNADKPKKLLPTFKSFRIKKQTNKRSGRSNPNDRLVADFFDVQSLSSEPDFVGNSRLKKAHMKESRSSRMLETRSVSSTRSMRSNFFGPFFLRMKAVNDEVEGIEDDSPDLTGIGIDAYEGSFVDDDEELTLASGFDNMSLVDSVQDDEYSVGSRGSLGSLPNVAGMKETENAVLVEQPQEQKPEEAKELPFLQRILVRRSLKKEETMLRTAEGRRASATEGSTVVAPEEELRRSLPPVHRGKSLMQGNMMYTSSKSLGALPDSPVESAPEGKSRGPDERGLCRWDSDRSIGSNPMAPKRPKRRSGSISIEADDQKISPVKPPPSTNLPDQKLHKKPATTTSQSMRNLCVPSESKINSEKGDDDDDSVLSLLSGLLATWSSERDGIIVTATVTHEAASNSGSAWRPKSILKNSLETRGEQKDESREQYTVIFDKIEIREYERIVGDNPSCSRGPPISIGWEYLLGYQYPLNDYEQLIRPPRRSKKEFHLAADKRTHLLVNEWECSEDDIRKARREATYIQYCRAKTSFSGSRAAAKEAAFLRKANDLSKQMIMNKKVTMESNLIVESSPKAVSRRASNPEPEAIPVRPSLPPAVHSPSSSSRHRPLLEV